MRTNRSFTVIGIFYAVILLACRGGSSDQVKRNQEYADSAEIIQGALPVARQKDTTRQGMDSTVNGVNTEGKKKGLWIEDNGLTEVYYQDGKKNGIYKSYFKITGKLNALGWYEQDKPIGEWYYFDEASHLLLVEKVLKKNNSIMVKNDAGERILLPYKSYVKVYDKSGFIQSEGIALYNESIEIDFYMYGKWKYYDNLGKLAKEVVYSEGKIAS